MDAATLRTTSEEKNDPEAMSSPSSPLETAEATTTPPPTSSSTSQPTTPLTEATDPWEELSTGTAETSLSATFSVLKGYNRVPIYERRAQWLAEQQSRREQVFHHRLALPRGNAGDFNPNADLPFPITAQFLQSYGGGEQERGRRVHWSGNREGGGSGRTVVAAGMVVGMSEGEEEEYEYEEEGEGTSTIASPVSERSESGVHALVPSPVHRGEEESGVFRKPRLDRKTSGIPSFDSLFETKWDFDMLIRNVTHASSKTKKGWVLDEPKTSIRQSKDIPMASSSSSSRVSESSIFGSMHGSKATFGSYLKYLQSHRRSYSFGMLLFGCLSLVMLQNRFLMAGIMTETPLAQARYAYEGYNASQYATIDFPGLLSTETALEKSLASVAAAPALARLLKQSEITVSDLSTVVQHSDLDCKHTLSDLLLKFATQAGDVAGLLQAFESTVSRALTQLDSANAQTLQHLNHHLPPPLPFYKSLLRKNPHHYYHLLPSQTQHLSTAHEILAHHINNTLSALAQETGAILRSLRTLSHQHAPIYASIVREFTAIERAQTTLWTRARGVDYSESKELLALVGTYEEKARGYVERVGMEYVALRGELVGLREGLKEAGRVSGGELVPFEAQIRAVRGMVELKRTRDARMSARSGCLGGVGKRSGGGGAAVGYRGLFKPTKTKIT
ncbi:unnamed protein product [Tuber melanosporum]|uniref:(Perigord truffle) hypothetical protein n=1 Tax=Tuber melanosporum (strain Mel28) TaxID=656061 RepID=D5GDP5_TUBMM|nr:uncharacterized protein GSTUM_00006215001 [Tuber melanosporum]CAZ82638.1 unnamed protein product [Tuber melanosporum]